jgi:hypothetical protein
MAGIQTSSLVPFVVQSSILSRAWRGKTAYRKNNAEPEWSPDVQASTALAVERVNR